MSLEVFGGERRHQERWPLRTTATLLLPGGRTVEVRTFDISTTGVGIIAPVSPKIGTRLSVRVPVPQRPKGMVPFEAPVEVAHVMLSSGEGGFKVGMRYITIDPDALELITRFVSGR
jgi:c-di-GMP-binding flagellar brake protein YcgR